jgi:hypothetical protein
MKKEKDKKLSPFSKKTTENITQYKEFKEHTQVIELGDHVSCMIRLQKTIFPDKDSEIGVDIRKFLNGKYPFKGGKQGILIEKDKWLKFMQKAIDFTVSVFGKEVFYYDEPQPAPQQLPSPQKEQVKKEPKPPIRKKPGKESSQKDWITTNL